MSGAAVLRSISPDATPDEVAAIVAALRLLEQERAARVAARAPVSRWVYASRITARRAGYSRGEWRVSGRIGRRARA